MRGWFRTTCVELGVCEAGSYSFGRARPRLERRLALPRLSIYVAYSYLD